MPLNIIFAGTPEFAVPALEALLHSDHRVIAVYTQLDRPSGRGRLPHASPVKLLAQAHNLPIFQPKTLRDIDEQNRIRELKPDVMVVTAYGLILPEAVLSIPRFGCINIHPSLLPRWRGAAPIQRALESGDLETGITMMQMDKGMDTGPILKQEEYLYRGDETAAELHDFFSLRGAQLLLEVLEECEKDLLQPLFQNQALATHAAKITKEEAWIDWQQSARSIALKVRAFNSWPVTETLFHGKILRIWDAVEVNERAKLPPGTLIRLDKNVLCVATGQGVLEIKSVQLPGKKQMSAADFMHGYRDLLVPLVTKFAHYNDKS